MDGWSHTVSAFIGNVSVEVILYDGQTVTRHQDFIREKLNNEIDNSSIDIESQIETSVEPSPIESSSILSSSVELSSETTESHSPVTPVSRYPTRQRQPPDRYSPNPKSEVVKTLIN